MKMLKSIAIVLFVLLLSTAAFAGPECKSYTMHYQGNVYTFEFSCETAGIGEVQTKYNEDEYTQWWLYYYDGKSFVGIVKLGYFELMDYNLYHIIYDYTLKKWYRTGLVFSDDAPEPEEEG